MKDINNFPEGTSYKATILGCGSSGGVPRIGRVWGDCDPSNPKNKRRRCSLLIQRRGEKGDTNVLVDTSPDIRDQLLETETFTLDGVLYTHSHADQSHGINDLRMVAINARRRIPVYMDAICAEVLTKRFDYCFTDLKTGYLPFLDLSIIKPRQPVQIEGEGGSVRAEPFEQDHGSMRSLGFRFEEIAYSSDVVNLDEEAFRALQGVKFWIVDALRWEAHPTHAHVEKTLEWIDRVKPERAILTNLDIGLDYKKLAQFLPKGVEPAYDGLTLYF